MRKSLFFLCLLVSSVSVFGQSNIFPGDGNVGVGTTTPTKKLHVNGNTRLDGTITSSKSAVFGEDVSISSFPLQLGKAVNAGRRNFGWHIGQGGHLELPFSVCGLYLPNSN